MKMISYFKKNTKPVVWVLTAIIFSSLCLWLFAGTEDKTAFAKVYKGDSKNYRFTIKDEYNYEVVDLTGYTIKFRVKQNTDDAAYVIDKSCTNLTQTGTTKGQATLVLATTDTNITAGTYYAYVILTNTGGTVYETLIQSKWIIAQ